MQPTDESWKLEILVRDSLEAMTLISYISNLMYSPKDYPYASQRYDRLMEDGGRFMREIEAKAKAKVEELQPQIEEIRKRVANTKSPPPLRAAGQVLQSG